MDRRAFLGAATAGISALAGCSATTVVSAPEAPTDDGTPTAPATPTPLTHGGTSGRESPPAGAGVELPVPKSALRRPVPRDAIPAIVDPVFGPDWDGVEIELEGGTYRPRLGADDRVIGVRSGDVARAYPLSVLSWHEAVNDVVAGAPLLVTYCPLCRSAVVAERTVRGRPTVFGVSGYLWRENLVLYDRRTDSLWSQLLATAIRGPETGTPLELRPASVTTWGRWRETHPDADVLLPPPRSPTVVGTVRFNYSFDLYEQWERIWARYPDQAPGSTSGDTRVPPRELVIGVRSSGVAKAYPRTRVGWAGMVNDEVGGRPVVVALADGDQLVAYDRRVGGGTIAFDAGGDRTVTGGGSRWDLTSGRALDGPHEGERLRQANDLSPMLWFAWLAFNPETEVYVGPE